MAFCESVFSCFCKKAVWNLVCSKRLKTRDVRIIIYGLHLYWFKRYDTKCKHIFLDMANYEMINGSFRAISSSFVWQLPIYPNFIKLIDSDGHFDVLNRSRS